MSLDIACAAVLLLSAPEAAAGGTSSAGQRAAPHDKFPVPPEHHDAIVVRGGDQAVAIRCPGNIHNRV
jgi:hypothetical protein